MDNPPEITLTQRKDRLLKVIDLEIEELKRASSAPGWTPWALAGAFSASAIAFLDVLSSLKSYSTCFTIISLFVALYIFAIYWIQLFNRTEEKKIRPIQRTGNFRPLRLTSQVAIVSLVICGLMVPKLEVWGLEISLYLICSLPLIAMYGFLIFATGTNKAFCPERKPIWLLLVFIAGFGASMALVSILSYQIWNANFDPVSIKAAFLGSVCLALANVYPKIPTLPTEFSEYIDLKRQVLSDAFNVMYAERKYNKIKLGEGYIDFHEQAFADEANRLAKIHSLYTISLETADILIDRLESGFSLNLDQLEIFENEERAILKMVEENRNLEAFSIFLKGGGENLPSEFLPRSDIEVIAVAAELSSMAEAGMEIANLREIVFDKLQYLNDLKVKRGVDLSIETRDWSSVRLRQVG